MSKHGPPRPRGLAIEESFFGPYKQEFDDDTFMIADVDIDKGRPSQVLNARLVIVLVISMSDDALRERSEWLCERGAFHAWVNPAQFTRMRSVAQLPQSAPGKYVHYAN